MTAHTPGPWRWNEHYAGLVAANGYEVLRYAAYEGMWVPDYEDCGEADATLIASAPDLLETAEAAYTFFGDFQNYWSGRQSHAGQMMLVFLRDSIARATGRDPQDVQDDYTTRATKAAETTTGPRPSADGFAETKSSSVSVGEVAKRALQANELEQHADRLADALERALPEIAICFPDSDVVEQVRSALAAYRGQQP